MNVKEYFRIGKMVATYGVKGELVLKHTLGKKSTLKGLQALFLEEPRDSFIPWFIQQATAKNETEILLKLEGVDSKEAARKFLQKEAWLPDAEFKKLASKSAPVSLLGYTIMENEKSLGPILEIIEQPHQVLCRLEMDEKEVLVPLNESTLQKIDHRRKRVVVQLPEGLLDLYLG